MGRARSLGTYVHSTQIAHTHTYTERMCAFLYERKRPHIRSLAHTQLAYITPTQRSFLWCEACLCGRRKHIGWGGESRSAPLNLDCRGAPRPLAADGLCLGVSEGKTCLRVYWKRGPGEAWLLVSNTRCIFTHPNIWPVESLAALRAFVLGGDMVSPV